MLKNYHALFIRSTNCRNNNLTFSNSIKEINLFISPNMLFLYVRHWQTNYDFLWLLISNNVGKTLWLIKAWKEKNQFISSNMFFPAPIWSYKNLIISLHRVLPNNINVHPFNILHSLRIRTQERYRYIHPSLINCYKIPPPKRFKRYLAHPLIYYCCGISKWN